MATFLNGVISDLWRLRGDVWGDLAGLDSQLYSAGTKLKAGDTSGAGQNLQNAAGKVWDLKYSLSWSSDSVIISTREGFQLVQSNWPEPSAVTMASILSAMYEATNTELLHFVGLVDAYRQSLWNKPFNQEFWAAIARGFEQWE